MARQAAVPFHFVGKADEVRPENGEYRRMMGARVEFTYNPAQGGLSVAGGCRCLTKELDMIAC